MQIRGPLMIIHSQGRPNRAGAFGEEDSRFESAGTVDVDTELVV